jgi:hypothetical protein
MTDAVTSYQGYNAEQAASHLRSALADEIRSLTELVMETARSNVRYYPNVRGHIQQSLAVLAGQVIEGKVTADYWEAWLEEYGKGSLMAGPDQNPGLVAYMNSEYWNPRRPQTTRVVRGRGRGYYKSISSTNPKYSGGSYSGENLELLAEQGKLPPEFKPTPPSFFMRNALQSNKQRILQGLQHVIDDFPYHKYFRMR